MVRCQVLIGTPRNYGRCTLPGDPCIFHVTVKDPPRTWDELRAVWLLRGRRTYLHRPKWDRRRIA